MSVLISRVIVPEIFEQGLALVRERLRVKVMIDESLAVVFGFVLKHCRRIDRTLDDVSELDAAAFVLRSQRRRLLARPAIGYVPRRTQSW